MSIKRIFTILLVLVLHHLSESYLAPTFGNYAVCTSKECLASTVEALMKIDHLIIGIVSENFETDSYLALYLGNAL